MHMPEALRRGLSAVVLVAATSLLRASMTGLIEAPE